MHFDYVVFVCFCAFLSEIMCVSVFLKVCLCLLDVLSLSCCLLFCLYLFLLNMGFYDYLLMSKHPMIIICMCTCTKELYPKVK